MGIWTPATGRTDIAEGGPTLTRLLWPDGVIPSCFHCAEPLDELAPFVYWMGPHAIALHVECAIRLAVGLIGDAREIDLTRERWPIRSQQLVRAVVAKRIAAEHREG